jgi:hypothetical protein
MFSYLGDFIGMRDAAAHVPVVAISRGQVAGAQKYEGHHQHSKGVVERHSIPIALTISTAQVAMYIGICRVQRRVA